ncbi:uncharacterized protein H6S33_010468 [Morchella sextelata]|uniref:uncharacterized protein n=1 Tax=Morchella sextelata TaxID=1174677 RepID=UPI001D05797F|nr:uncharacterized protein H6S33_010468 [Morchella sextelata]KAH0612416.1 hypothetical protein H6S33_010468 [Morchella sextelata]
MAGPAADVKKNAGGAFVRPYNAETDYDAVLEICKATADASYASALELVPYLYAIPYLLLSPTYAHVLDSGAGTVVGYIIGTPNTRAFVRRYRDTYLPRTTLPPPTSDPPSKLRRSLEESYARPEGMIREDVVDEFPAHLHVDILESHQSQGWGTVLMERFLGELKGGGEAVKGVHLAMGKENVRAGRFYGRCGFVARGDLGDGATWMARGMD